MGQELTVFYEDNYFGLNNKDCRCDDCKSFPKELDFFDFSKLRKRKNSEIQICGSFICYCGKCRLKDALNLETANLDMQFLWIRNTQIFNKKWPNR